MTDSFVINKTIYSSGEVGDVIAQLLGRIDAVYSLSEEKRYCVRLVLNETLANAFEHSERDWALIHCMMNGNRLNFSVENDGVGFDRRDICKPCVEDGRGRGLFIIESISDSVAYEDGGRCVNVSMTL